MPVNSTARSQSQIEALVGGGPALSASQLLIQQYQDLGPDPNLRRATIQELLKRLQQFSMAHTKFFVDGFNVVGGVELDKSVEDPSDVVLGTIAFQTGSDLDVIKRAGDARLVTRLVSALQKADRLALAALNTAAALLPDIGDARVPLCYFNKSDEIRTMPYSSVAVIGIPLSCDSIDRNFLAIPHEVGHFVFWHRKIDPTQDPVNRNYVRDRFARYPKTHVPTPYANWQEEIFADVFGACVAGPMMAYDFQQLMSVFERRAFVARDGHHPAPFVRPLIYTHVLRKANKPGWKALADRLDAFWYRYLYHRWVLTFRNRFENIRNGMSAADQTRWDTAFPESDEIPDAEGAKQFLRDALAFRALDENEVDGFADDNFLKVLYHALDALAVEGTEIVLAPELELVVDAAFDLIFGKLVNANGWSDAAAFDAALDAEGTVPDDWFIAPLAAVAGNADLPNLAENGTSGDWEAWVRREQFFPIQAGVNVPGQTPAERVAAGGSGQIGAGKFFEVLQNLPTNPNPNEIHNHDNWRQLWFAAGWTTGIGRTNPPGG